MTDQKTKVAVLYGGKSTEHDVSIQTAFSVINAMNLDKYRVVPVYIDDSGRWIAGHEISGRLDHVDRLLLNEDAAAEEQVSHWLAPTSKPGEAPDIVFPLLHGPNGEDGTVQGLFELLNIAYVGSGVAGSAVGMDKVLMKDLLKSHGIEQPDYLSVNRSQWQADAPGVILNVKNTVGYPCFVKPANGGSSVGISKCLSETDLSAAIMNAFQFDLKVIIEQKVNGREVEIGVIGNDELAVSVPGEIITKDADFYDYQSKYQDGKTTLVIPADLSEKVKAQLEEVARRAFTVLNLSGLARVDTFIREGDQQVVVNEVNTMPGFTRFSMFPLLWAHSGLAYDRLIEKLIDLGQGRHRARQQITYRFNG